MYFFISGNPSYTISEATQSFHHHIGPILLMDEPPHKLYGSMIKWGEVVEKEEYDTIITNSEAFGKKLKTEGSCKRFIVTELKSKHPLSDQHPEIIDIGVNGKVGKVCGYQPISLYETIEFSRPVRSMKIGMMPAKLALTMINFSRIPHGGTIFDPFVGLGTTVMLANSLGYNVVGSDLNVSPSKQNRKWRQKTGFYQATKSHFFKHDATTPFPISYADAIVTEGWLGPHITRQSTHSDIERARELWKSVFIPFLSVARQKQIPIITCFPEYVDASMDTVYQMQKILSNDSYEIIDPAYQRKDQHIARRIVIISPGN